MKKGSSSQPRVVSTAVFGDQEIIAGVESGQLVIEPFDRSLVKSSSYDVRLGGNYYVAEQFGYMTDFSPYQRKAVESYYKGPLKAVTAAQWCRDNHRSQLAGIGPDEYVIVLRPGECLLCHTIEFIGARHSATTMMKARSSLGRINLSSCDDAGWGDVGYIDRWTLEVRNKNAEAWVPLVVGMPIAQLIFFHVGGATQNYGKGGHYQRSTDIRQLQKTWTPAKMLPQLYSRQNLEVRRRLLRTPKSMF